MAPSPYLAFASRRRPPPSRPTYSGKQLPHHHHGGEDLVVQTEGTERQQSTDTSHVRSFPSPVHRHHGCCAGVLRAIYGDDRPRRSRPCPSSIRTLHIFEAAEHPVRHGRGLCGYRRRKFAPPFSLSIRLCQRPCGRGRREQIRYACADSTGMDAWFPNTGTIFVESRTMAGSGPATTGRTMVTDSACADSTGMDAWYANTGTIFVESRTMAGNIAG